ncbi:hypothetical protein H1P_4040009 [Hyella patelloides LEGE 07179]|uniref:Uncharacterized protein n=1 Tax=Hyella patelloides LEGE 07179 TaxID=945734 RepID=A0A563VXF9_9CYAN|nr:hypothetical protein H1P_4040009 [Hyella patelloides LEGE 07179]
MLFSWSAFGSGLISSKRGGTCTPRLLDRLAHSLVSISVLNLTFPTLIALHLFTKLGFYTISCRNLTDITQDIA